jgi:hypothetical protein
MTLVPIPAPGSNYRVEMNIPTSRRVRFSVLTFFKMRAVPRGGKSGWWRDC